MTPRHERYAETLDMAKFHRRWDRRIAEQRAYWGAPVSDFISEIAKGMEQGLFPETADPSPGGPDNPYQGRGGEARHGVTGGRDLTTKGTRR